MLQVSSNAIWARCLTFSAAVCLMCACVSQTEPAPTGNLARPSAAMGLRYAQQFCVTCHAVAAGESRSPNPSAPSFEVIANLPGMTGTALNAWLHSPHPSMPNVIVNPADRENVAAYLESLRRGGGHA